MNITDAIRRREYGFGIIHDYDIALHRLKCYYNDVYHGISPNLNTADYNPDPPVFACHFCTTPGYEEILALANEDGKVAFQNTRIKNKYNQPLEGQQAHYNAIFDIAWMPGEQKLITASGDHTARLWDICSSQIKQINYFHAHTRSVKTAVFRDNDKESRRLFQIVTCSDDSCHRIWKVGLEDKEDNEEVKIRGRAEIVGKYHLENMKIETTPSSRYSNIYQETSPSSQYLNVCQKTTPSSEEHNTISTLAVTPEFNESDKEDDNKLGSTKRSYLQMMMGSRSEGKFKSILSPIHENETSAKRIHMDNRGMRRLFSSSNEIPTTSRDNDSDEPSTSQSASKNEAPFSPTLNLPNFVVDGTAPHLLEISPQKYKENVDWLTKIRKERYEQKKTSSISNSPKTQVTPGRRSNRSRSTEPQKVTKPIKSGSLLDFFKAASKNNEKNSNNNNNNNNNNTNNNLSSTDTS
ncbi:protein lethal(2)denticleless [Pogonomyrmex barbatus]|uniref:Protein lethal(2)denticleless n=1 Tax=Pogonomyrmex barbatus TaxID=144034 RepID=A0A6I9W535_9HYME|nr:protein lethal(2)denticleless [Pogonomyrmex barbatus]